MVAACSFPELVFSDLDGSRPDGQTPDGVAPNGEGGPSGDGSSAGDGSSTGDGSTVTDGGTDAPVFIGDGGTLPDAQHVDVDASSCCDCDNDTFYRDAACAPDGAVVAQLDCDDFEGSIYPGHPYVKDLWPGTATHTPAYDWDCDGVVERYYDGGLAPTDCPPTALGCGAEGFQGQPECGHSLAYGACTVQALACGYVESLEPHVQACK